MKKFILSIIALALLTSCKVNNAPVIETKTLQLSEAQKVRVLQDNDFAFELMKLTIAEASDKNVFISP